MSMVSISDTVTYDVDDTECVRSVRISVDGSDDVIVRGDPYTVHQTLQQAADLCANTPEPTDRQETDRWMHTPET